MIPCGVTTLLGVAIPLRKLGVTLRSAFAEWWRVPWRDLELGEKATKILALSVLIGISLLALLARLLRSSKAGRTHVTLPALLPMMRSSSLSTTRHLPFLLFLVGLPFFAVALADLLNFRFVSSETLNPELYNTSMIALFLGPSNLEWSIAASSVSIS